jgi:hypothetical protein
MAAPIIVAVGAAIIRTTAKQLPKVLRRFKGAKEVKSPTPSQIDRAGTITKDLGNFSAKSRNVLKKADTARPSVVQSLTGTGRTSGQKAMQGVTTGEARRTATKAVAGAAAAGTTGYAIGSKDDKPISEAKPKTKAKTKPDPRKDKQIPLPKQKPKKPKSKVTPPKPKPKPKKKQNGVKFVFETKKKGK